MRFTQEQYEAYLARRASQGSPPPSRVAPGRGGARTTEADLHGQIIEFCKANGWIAFHGSMAHASHRTLGEPDFILLSKDIIHLIECKTRTSKLSPEQLGMQKWAANLGHTIHIVREFSEFLQIVTPSLPGSSPPGSSSRSSSPPHSAASDSSSSSDS